MRCVICTDCFDGHEIVATQCGHVFHSKCLLKWIDCSKTCPKCRGPVSSKNILKLYPKNVSNDKCEAALIENDISTLKARIREKCTELEVELETSEKKFKEFQKDLVLNHQRKRKPGLVIATFELKLSSLSGLLTEFQELEEEICKLLKEMENYSNVKSILSASQKDVETLKAQIRGKNTELETSKKKFNELQLRAAIMEKDLELCHQKERQLFAFSGMEDIFNYLSNMVDNLLKKKSSM